jgi:hypothetical protein
MNIKVFNMITNWKEYRKLLKKQRLYEKCLYWSWHPDCRQMFENLIYWARKDVEAFEEKSLLKKNR